MVAAARLHLFSARRLLNISGSGIFILNPRDLLRAAQCVYNIDWKRLLFVLTARNFSSNCWRGGRADREHVCVKHTPIIHKFPLGRRRGDKLKKKEPLGKLRETYCHLPAGTRLIQSPFWWVYSLSGFIICRHLMEAINLDCYQECVFGTNSITHHTAMTKVP